MSASTMKASKPLLFNLSSKRCAAVRSWVAEICTDQVLAERSFFAAGLVFGLASALSAWVALRALTSRFLTFANETSLWAAARRPAGAAAFPASVRLRPARYLRRPQFPVPFETLLVICETGSGLATCNAVCRPSAILSQ
jgi:hypothetical protein